MLNGSEQALKNWASLGAKVDLILRPAVVLKASEKEAWRVSGCASPISTSIVHTQVPMSRGVPCFILAAEPSAEKHGIVDARWDVRALQLPYCSAAALLLCSCPTAIVGPKWSCCHSSLTAE